MGSDTGELATAGSGVTTDSAAAGLARAAAVRGAEAAPRSSRPRRLPRRESRGAGAEPPAAGSLAGSLDGAAPLAEAAAGLSPLAGGLAGLPTLPAPPRRRRPWEDADSAFAGAGLLLSLAFAAVLSSTDPSVTAASVPARPLPLRGAMLRIPKTPGLMRTRSVEGRRASACKRDCIISSGSRPTTDSRSYFRAKRVKSLKCRGLPSRRRTSNAASRNVILDKPRGAGAPNFERRVELQRRVSI